MAADSCVPALSWYDLAISGPVAAMLGAWVTIVWSKSRIICVLGRHTQWLGAWVTIAMV